MADGWYVKRDDKKYGPYTSAQLVEMAKRGQVLPLDWVARGEAGQWMPASQVKGLFAAPTQAAVPPPLPQDSAPSTPASTFAFEPQADPSAAPAKRMTRRLPARVSKPILAAILGGALVVIVLVIYFATRGGSNNPTVAGSQAGTAGKGLPKGETGNKRGPESRKPGKMYLDDLVAKMGPPSRSYTKIDNSTIAVYSLHVWDAGGGFYDLVFTALPTQINEPEFIQSTQSDVNKTRLDALLTGYRPK